MSVDARAPWRRSLTRGRRHALIVLSLLGIVIAVAAALMVRLDASAPRPPGGNDQLAAERPVAPPIDPIQRRAFAVLRQPPEPLGVGMQAAVERAIAGQGIDLSFSAAHHVRTATGEWTWIVPAGSWLCVVRERVGSVACSTTDQALRHGVQLQAANRARGRVRGRWEYLLIGLAPDGVRAARVTSADRAPDIVPVVGGVYIDRAHSLMRVTLLR